MKKTIALTVDALRSKPPHHPLPCIRPPPLISPILAASCLACIALNLLDLANTTNNEITANNILHATNS